MKCRDFDEAVSDLARAHLMEASTRVAAESHAGQCERCGSMLMDERIIAQGLAAIADVDREKIATKWNETDLRAAFRAHRIEEQSPVAGLNPHLEASPMRLAMAIAAGLIVLLGGFAAWRVAGSGSERTPPVALQGPRGAETPKKPAETQKSPEPVISQRAPGVAGGERALVRSGSKRSSRKTIPSKVVDSSSVVGSLADLRPLINETEEVSDFFPLVPGGAGTALTRGQVVRVVMPRSAMAYFGLPVNADRSESQVKADVLFGEDNLARAIRFVR